MPIIITIQIGEEGLASEALRQRVEEDVKGFGFELQISDEGGITRFSKWNEVSCNGSQIFQYCVMCYSTALCIH